MRIITGALAFFESSAGIAIEMAPGILLPKPPPVYSLISTTCFGRNADPARDRTDGLHRALRRAVHEQLAVLPVGHRRARFERLVTGRLADECFVEHEVGLLEARLDVAARPFVRCGLPIGIWPLLSAAVEVGLVPLQFGDLRGGPAAHRRAARRDQHRP